MINMTVAFSNLSKIGVGVAKEKYGSEPTPTTPPWVYLINYFDSDRNQIHATLTLQPWLKLEKSDCKKYIS